MTSRESLVAGVDGSSAGTRALRWALSEGRRRNVPVYAIMVWESHAVLAGPAPLLMDPKLAPHSSHLEHWKNLTHIVRECTGGKPGPEVHTELVEGDAAAVLTDRSARAAMLVVGDTGRSAVAEVVLGGTALRCIHRARCPVVVVPAGMELPQPGDEPAEAETTDPVLG